MARARVFPLGLGVYLLLGLALAWLMRGLRTDDPFITYRYVENLAAGQGFAFNPGERSLITTAPLYALLLALLRLAGADVPGASFVIGALSLVAGAGALFALGLRRGTARAGFIAGLGLLLFPLLWLAMGFETLLFAAAALLMALALDAGRFTLAGLLAGVAIGLRGDGLLLLALAIPAAGFRCGRRSLAALALAAALIYAPLALWLAAQFGSPVPTTLQTKAAQAASGLTGFYPHTTFAEGAVILVRAYFAQSPLFGLILPAALAGAIYWLAGLRAEARIGWGARLGRALSGYGFVIAWMAAHLAGYSAIGVAPYAWYYAPLVPGLMALVGLGAEGFINFTARLRAAPQWLRGAVVVLPLCGPMLIGDAAIVRVLSGAIPPPPAEIAAKVLPETKVDIYARAGRWLNANTPPTATVGMTELGVISYYARRRAVDFLGLTQPEHLDAIRRGDYAQALLREQPDYLALTGVNALYEFDPQKSDWFKAMYTPIASFDDPRFWGSPVTIWRRAGAPLAGVVILDEGAHDLGGGWQVTAISASARDVAGGQPVILRLQLQAGNAMGDRDLRVQAVALDGADGLPVTSRVIHTDLWRAGEQAWVDFPFLPQPEPRAGGYAITAQWAGGGPAVVAGKLKAPLNVSANSSAVIAPLSGGVGVELFPDALTLCWNAPTTITLHWRGGDLGPADYTAFVHLRDARDNTVVQADGPPRGGAYPTSLWASGEVIPDPHTFPADESAPPGQYVLVVGLYDPVDGARWPVDASPYRTPDGGVKIGEVEVRECP